MLVFESGTKRTGDCRSRVTEGGVNQKAADLYQ